MVIKLQMLDNFKRGCAANIISNIKIQWTDTVSKAILILLMFATFYVL